MANSAGPVDRRMPPPGHPGGPGGPGGPGMRGPPPTGNPLGAGRWLFYSKIN